MSGWMTSNQSYGGAYKSSPWNYPSQSSTSSSYVTGGSSYDVPTGLHNLGNTCYISSVMQVFFQLISEKQFPITSKSQQRVTYHFFELKRTKDTKEYKTFKEILQERIEIVKGWDQQDAHQFLIHFLEQLRKENSQPLKGGGKTNFQYNEKLDYHQNWEKFVSQMRKFENSKIISLFYGQILKRFTCPYGHNKHNFERFMDLSLPFTPKSLSNSGIYSSHQPLKLRDMIHDFLGYETIDDLFCEQCKKKTRFEKQSIFYDTPTYLVIHLNRFVKGWYSNEKNDRQVQFDESFEHHERNGKQKVTYKLRGLVHHMGTLNRGHYYANIKVGQDWYEMNDDKVTKENIKQHGNISSSVYLLIYEKK